MTPVIEVEGLVREFKGPNGTTLPAVDGVDLAVHEGEIYAFLGPNGAGKTTLVRMLVTLLRPTRGTARVGGSDIVREPGKVRASIGVTLQEAALDPLMTGFELLQLQATLHVQGKSEASANAEAMLE